MLTQHSIFSVTLAISMTISIMTATTQRSWSSPDTARQFHASATSSEQSCSSFTLDRDSVTFRTHLQTTFEVWKELHQLLFEEAASQELRNSFLDLFFPEINLDLDADEHYINKNVSIKEIRQSLLPMVFTKLKESSVERQKNALQKFALELANPRSQLHNETEMALIELMAFVRRGNPHDSWVARAQQEGLKSTSEQAQNVLSRLVEHNLYPINGSPNQKINEESNRDIRRFFMALSVYSREELLERLILLARYKDKDNRAVYFQKARNFLLSLFTMSLQEKEDFNHILKHPEAFSEEVLSHDLQWQSKDEVESLAALDIKETNIKDRKQEKLRQIIQAGLDTLLWETQKSVAKRKNYPIAKQQADGAIARSSMVEHLTHVWLQKMEFLNKQDSAFNPFNQTLLEHFQRWPKPFHAIFLGQFFRPHSLNEINLIWSEDSEDKLTSKLSSLFKLPYEAIELAIGINEVNAFADRVHLNNIRINNLNKNKLYQFDSSEREKLQEKINNLTTDAISLLQNLHNLKDIEEFNSVGNLILIHLDLEKQPTTLLAKTLELLSFQFSIDPRLPDNIKTLEQRLMTELENSNSTALSKQELLKTWIARVQMTSIAQGIEPLSYEILRDKLEFETEWFIRRWIKLGARNDSLNRLRNFGSSQFKNFIKRIQEQAARESLSEGGPIHRVMELIHEQPTPSIFTHWTEEQLAKQMSIFLENSTDLEN